MNRSFLVSVIAGTALTASALAQKSVNGAAPQHPAQHHAGARLVEGVPQRGRAPDFVRSVRLQNGLVIGASEWQAYHGNSTDASSTYVFDAIQDGPGVTPGTLPTSNRYLLLWTAGTFDYTGPLRAHDMMNIPSFARGQGAKMLDTLFYEGAAAGTPLYVAYFTSDATNDVPQAPDASWGVFPGIQFAWATGIGTGFWFVPIDVTTQAPPVGDGWMMPADGVGGYIVQATRDPAGTLPALMWQTGLWGTGNSAQPPVARVGTQTNIEWTDESTPPNCGAASLVQNVPNNILEGGLCENQAWTFAVAAPAPTNLATAVGFGMVPSVSNCYANCDGSTGVGFLNINDFVCFQSAFAAGGSYANCDGSTGAGNLNINDFVCFQSAFAAGCSAP